MSRWTEEQWAEYVRTHPGAEIGPVKADAVEPPKRSKFRNVKTRADGIVWDSRHEAEHYLLLKARAAAGEITDLRWKVRFPLVTVNHAIAQYLEFVVAEYVADFVYVEGGARKVVDTKGYLTQMYKLKRKWLALQEGVEIIEVYAAAS